MSNLRPGSRELCRAGILGKGFTCPNVKLLFLLRSGAPSMCHKDSLSPSGGRLGPNAV